MRVILITVAIVLTLPLLLLLAGWDTMRRNDRRLTEFSEQLFAYPLPPASRILRQTAEVGVLTGNGNHCDYVARLELASSLPPMAVEAHYQGLRLHPAVANGAGGGLPAVTVESQGPGRMAVTATDAPYPAGLDTRCH